MKIKNNPFFYFAAFLVVLLLSLGVFNYAQRQLSTNGDASLSSPEDFTSEEQIDAAPSVVPDAVPTNEALSESDSEVLGTVLGKDQPSRSNFYGLLNRLNGYKTNWFETSPSRFTFNAKTAFATQDQRSNTCVILVYSSKYDAERDKGDVYFKMNPGTTYWLDDDSGLANYISQAVILISNDDSSQCIDDANKALGW
jgi:hypothetical protein